MKRKDILSPKDGRERVRRSIIAYRDTMDKFTYIAHAESVPIYELLEQLMAQAVDTWEHQHGVITLREESQPTTATTINLNKAIETANARPALKRGNPHPTGRKPKNKKVLGTETPDAKL